MVIIGKGEIKRSAEGWRRRKRRKNDQKKKRTLRIGTLKHEDRRIIMDGWMEDVEEKQSSR